MSLSKDGLLIASSKWQSALQELTITVNIASNSPTLAGDTITLVIPKKIGEVELRKLPLGDLRDYIAAGL